MSILAAVAVPHPPIIMPEVGHGEEKKIQKTIDAYREVMRRAAALKPDTVVVISPHSTMYADYFHISPGKQAKGDFGSFGAPQVQLAVQYDEQFAQTLGDACMEEDIPAGPMGDRQPNLDHGTLIPLRYLSEQMDLPPVVRIGLSGLPARMHYRLGQHIRETAEKLGRNVLLVASGDLSHKLKADGPYGFAAQGPAFDALATKALGEGDFLSLLDVDPGLADGAAECGLRSYWIMAGALDRTAVETELLSYEGPFGVGYGVAWIHPTGTDASRNLGDQLEEVTEKKIRGIRNNEDDFVKLARLSLETYVETHVRQPVPDGLPAELTEKRSGAFVSIHKDGALRGCIGTFLPTQQCLAEEIARNAVSAGLQDPRFDSVTAEELPYLVYNVDVLSTPEPIDSPKELDVKKYGVIVQNGDRRGLLLPDLDGVDTVQQQIAIARRKANIGDRERVNLWRFTVERHH